MSGEYVSDLATYILCSNLIGQNVTTMVQVHIIGGTSNAMKYLYLLNRTTISNYNSIQNYVKIIVLIIKSAIFCQRSTYIYKANNIHVVIVPRYDTVVFCTAL